ncbi:MAG TPA: methyltransferase domain-containing protein [Anaerolineales bacterium]|nr:methyltransferase domain-containing protein [Anaerolineales bacterium]
MIDPIRAQQLRAGVHNTYSVIASAPQAEHPIPVGRAFAKALGYPVELIDRFPLAAESFAGVSNVSIFADLPPGATVLDLGCGAGLDSLIAAERVGPNGQVIGLDFSETMLERARRAATEGGLRHADFRPGEAERIPLPDSSIDIALVNGIFNLNPAREAIFCELARVVKPDGALYSAEIVLREPLPPEERDSLTDWFA